MEYYIKKNDVVSMLMKEAKSHGLSFSAEAYERAANIVACMPNEDVQPAPKWISVKERLPEIGRSVLIYYPKWDGDEIQVAKLEDDGMMFDICGEFNIGTGAVTHWMPLPEPPNEKVQPASKHTENMSTIAFCDRFICKNCDLHLEGWVKVVIDPDDGDELHYEYEFKFCPECGAKVEEE